MSTILLYDEKQLLLKITSNGIQRFVEDHISLKKSQLSNFSIPINVWSSGFEHILLNVNTNGYD